MYTHTDTNSAVQNSDPPRIPGVLAVWHNGKRSNNKQGNKHTICCLLSAFLVSVDSITSTLQKELEPLHFTAVIRPEVKNERVHSAIQVLDRRRFDVLQERARITSIRGQSIETGNRTLAADN